MGKGIYVRQAGVALYIHAAWATWDRLPLLVDEVERAAHRALAAKCHELGAEVVALGGIEDHVHLLVKLPAALPLPREEPPPTIRAEVAAAPPLAEPPPAAVIAADEAPPPGWTRISDGFTLPHPPAESWRLFGNLPAVAACMPGALLEASDGNRLRGRFRVKLGPIGASFAGEAELLRDDACRIGQITGGGKDAQSGSQASGRVIYRLTPAKNAAATHVAVTLDFRLQGMLAQFGRSGLVRDLITRTTAEFARNLATLGAPAEGGATMPATPRPAAALDAGSLLGAVFWGRLKRWLQRWRGHRD